LACLLAAFTEFETETTAAPGAPTAKLVLVLMQAPVAVVARWQWQREGVNLSEMKRSMTGKPVGAGLQLPQPPLLQLPQLWLWLQLTTSTTAS